MVVRNRDSSDETVIGVVGGKKSGKTTTIEILTRELTERGYRVAVAKHIPEVDFTIDTEGKDTWRFVQSGAKTVVAASAEEIATIEKISKPSFNKILEKCAGSDIVFLEGFRKILAKNMRIPKIAVVKSSQDVEKAVKEFKPILVFTGPYEHGNTSITIPWIDVLTHGKEIADLVEKLVS